jgi:hypothetical protein
MAPRRCATPTCGTDFAIPGIRRFHFVPPVIGTHCKEELFSHVAFASKRDSR